MSKQEFVRFKGKVNRVIYEKDDFRIVSMDVDKDEDVVINKYGNVTIKGEIDELNLGIDYDVIGVSENSKYGIAYNVISITPNKPKEKEDICLFLDEIEITRTQQNVLLEVYPNIVDLVANDENFVPDYSKLKGIKEYTFGKIKEKILDNFIFSDIIEEFGGAINLSVIKRLYNKYKSVEKVKIEINNDPYKCMYSVKGFGFTTVDTIILDMYKKGHDFGYNVVTSPQRCKAYVQYYILQSQNNGNTVVDIVDCKRSVEEEVSECSQHFYEVIEDKELFQYFEDRFLLQDVRTYNTEKYIAETIKSMLQVQHKELEYNEKDIVELDGIKFTDEQMRTPKMVSQNSFSILSGFGGTGKSQVIKMLIQILRDNHIDYLLFAPTARAAKVMKEYTNCYACTIHRGLRANGNGDFDYNVNNKLKTDIIIVDEASMIDINLFMHLLKAIDINKTRLLLIGDPAQLPSVGCGNLLHDLLNSDIIPKNTLTKIFRYGEGGLAKAATDVRETKKYLGNIDKKITTYGANKDYSFIETSQENVDISLGDLEYIYKKLLTKVKIEEVQVLTSYKKGATGTYALNGRLQKIANNRVNIPGEKCLIVGLNKFFIDDVVIQKENNYKSRMYEEDVHLEDLPTMLIANGDIGKIIDIKEDYVLIDFYGDIIMYDKKEMTTVQLAYAITIHSSQGSTIPYVVLYTPRSQMYMLSSNLLYVGLSRTKNKCYHVGDKATIDVAVKKKDNLTRKTMLSYLLNNKQIKSQKELMEEVDQEIENAIFKK